MYYVYISSNIGSSLGVQVRPWLSGMLQNGFWPKEDGLGLRFSGLGPMIAVNWLVDHSERFWSMELCLSLSLAVSLSVSVSISLSLCLSVSLSLCLCLDI